MASFLIFREGYSEGMSGMVPPQKEKNLAQDAWLLPLRLGGFWLGGKWRNDEMTWKVLSQQIPPIYI